MKRNCFVKTPSHLCERRRKVRLGLRHFFLLLHGEPFSLHSFPLLFVSSLCSLSFLILKAERQPFISHQVCFMTAAALHSCWTVCLKKISDKAMNTLSGCSPLLSLLGWTEMLKSTRPARSTAAPVVHEVQQLQL